MPDGGRFDEDPPYVVASSPADKAVGQTHVKKVRITFNEYVKLDGASEKVIISPPQEEQPDLYTSGKSVVMSIFDTLQANTTYTIDFGDAIVDNNEANPMGNYTYSFSTGDHIDTLEVSGYVMAAENLEPVKGILVGLYRTGGEDSDLENSENSENSKYSEYSEHSENSESSKAQSFNPDTLLSTRRLERVSRTDGDGRFSIKGVAPGRYRVYALADVDGDYRFSQKSEMMAFDGQVYIPSCRPDLRHDTVWIDSTRYEKILHTPYTHFLPDDIVLRAYNEAGQTRNLLKSQRLEPLSFTLYFTAPGDTLPQIEVLDGGAETAGGWGDTAQMPDPRILPQPNPTYDTIRYWIVDTALAYRDTLTLRYTYVETDSADAVVMRADTIDLVPRVSRQKQVKELEKKVDDWVKRQTKRLERYEKKLKKFTDQYPDSVYQYAEQIDTVRALCPLYKTALTLGVAPSGSISPLQNLHFTCAEPLARIDTTMMRFTHQVDSLWLDAPFLVEHDSINPCVFHLYAEWELGEKYRFETDSASICTVYGTEVQPLGQDISVSNMDAYGSLFVQVRGIELSDSAAIIVQLLDKNDKVRHQLTADRDGRADFFFLSPGQIYMRCYVDMNGDGKWTTGCYAEGRQPEPVYYFPRPFNIRAKWELEQTWAPTTVELLRQKPAELVKQKEKKKGVPSAKLRNMQRDAENQYGQMDKKK